MGNEMYEKALVATDDSALFKVALAHVAKVAPASAVVLRRELLALSRACGAPGPEGVSRDSFDMPADYFGARPAREVFSYDPGWGAPAAGDALEAAPNA
jgi:hypothetical protein